MAKPLLPNMSPGDIRQIVEKLKFDELDRVNKLVAEKNSRSIESLKLWKPLPPQEKFHRSRATKRLVIGGWRGGKAQPVDEPVLTPNGFVPIGELQVGDVVIGGDGNPCIVTGVFPQGKKEVFRVTFDDGSWTRCCNEHLWKVKAGRNYRVGKNRLNDEWRVMSLGNLRSRYGDEPKRDRDRFAIPVCVPWMPKREMPIDPYILGLLLGDGSFAAFTPRFTTGDSELAAHVECAVGKIGCKVRKISEYDYAISKIAKYRNPLLDAVRWLGLQGKKSCDKFIPKSYLYSVKEDRLALLQGLMDTDGSITEERKDSGQGVEFSTSSPQLAEDVAYLVRSLGGKCRIKWRESHYTKNGLRHNGRPSARLRISLRECPFRMKRKVDRWKSRTHFTPNRIMRSVVAAGTAECVCISVSSPDHTYVTRDCIVTHNTLSCAVEVARAITGQDPHKKYPDRPLTVWIVCWEEGNIGRTIHRLLFKAGAFDIIPDERTGEWRPYVDETDSERAHLRKPAPPLVPSRYLAGGYEKAFAWKEKGRRIFSVCRMDNGTEIYTFSSGGDPPTGDPVDLVWIDEDLQYEEHVEELKARLSDRGGKLIWSAKPRSRNNALYKLHVEAEDQVGSPDPSCEEFQLAMSKNPYLNAKHKREQIATWTDEERRIYDFGDFVTAATLVYPAFAMETHGVPQNVDMRGHPDEDQPWDVDRLLVRTHGEIPGDWTRYMAVDPGHTVCAVLFAAVPPPQFGDFVVVYDELYLKECDPPFFGKRVAEKVGGQSFYAFIIDDHGSRIRTAQASLGRTIRQQYADELRARGVESETTGSSFIPGCDDIESRQNLLRSWMAYRGDGSTRLRVAHNRTPELVRELKFFRRKMVNGVLTDEVLNKRHGHHVVDALEYLAAHNAGRGPDYHPPIPRKTPRDEMFLAFQQLFAKKKSGMISLGPGKN